MKLYTAWDRLILDVIGPTIWDAESGDTRGRFIAERWSDYSPYESNLHYCQLSWTTTALEALDLL